MRFFLILIIFLIASGPSRAYAQNSLPEESPSTDEYSNVPPGLLISDGNIPAPSTEETPVTNESDVMTMDDINAAYKKGDFDIVLKHIMPIAKGNYPVAQELLGIMYRNGEGVPKDPTEAISWLSKAAEAGRPVAEHHLATMSYLGEGEPADPVKALMWLYIAVAHYPEGAGKEQAKQDLENVISQLSRRDKDRGYGLAHDWLEKRGETTLLPPRSIH